MAWRQIKNIDHNVFVNKRKDKLTQMLADSMEAGAAKNSTRNTQESINEKITANQIDRNKSKHIICEHKYHLAL